MRTLPSLELDLPAPTGWTRLVDALALLALATIAAWWWAADSAPTEPWRSAWLAVGILTILLSLHARRGRAGRLRWDGQEWSWRPLAPAGAADRWMTGRLGVMLDLQWALLLRFEPTDGVRPRRALWLPVGRRRVAADWHALRCAVYGRQVSGSSIDDLSREVTR